MNEKVIFGSLLGAVAVLLLVAVLRPAPEPLSFKKTDDTAAAVAEAEPESETEVVTEEASAPEPESTETTESVEEAPDQVAELTARIEELEQQLLAITEQTAQAATSEDLAAIQSRVDDVAEDLGTQAADLSARLGAVQDQVAEAVQSATSVREPVPTSGTEQPETEAEQAETEGEPEEGIKSEARSAVGETALLADGEVRIFVSRVTEDNARLSINGATVSLKTGAQHIFNVGDNYCGVTLDGTDGTAAQVSALCGDDLPPPEGVGVGETASLADGALRVFISRVTDSDARLSVNGANATVALGQSIRVTGPDTPCRVTLDAIDRGHVKLSHLCGAEAGISAATAPGVTAVLHEGAVRVFVSSVSEGRVRFAINGQSMQSASAGSEMMLEDGCVLSVADVTDGAASFGIACE